MDSDASFAFPVSGERRAETLTISLAIRDGACEPSGGSVSRGPLVIGARNETDRSAIVGVVQVPPGGEDHGMLTFRPFLSGKRLLMTRLAPEVVGQFALRDPPAL